MPTVKEVREYLDLMDPHHTLHNHNIELVLNAVKYLTKDHIQYNIYEININTGEEKKVTVDGQYTEMVKACTAVTDLRCTIKDPRTIRYDLREETFTKTDVDVITALQQHMKENI